MERKRVGILVFPEVEILDFCGPFEVFSVTRLDEADRRQTVSPFEVFLVAESAGPVLTRGGMRVLPDYTLESCPPLDILVVPGGWGVREQIHNPRLLGWINERAGQVETLTAVCTGSMLLGKAGLLAGSRATTHWTALGWMKESFPDTIVETTLHVVEDGSLITSAGISAGIDMALCVVSRYHGERVARLTARQMEYRWEADNTRRVAI